MAIWNKIEQDYLNQERSLFEVFNIATKDGIQVDENNRFPVSIGATNIIINGSVTVGVVTVTSTPESPVHTHVTEVGTSQILNVPYMPVGIGTTVNLDLPYLPVGISTLLNKVSISNTSFYVTGVGSTVNVSVANTSFYVTGVGSTVNVSGTVSIGNTVNVSVANTSFYVTGVGSTVNVSGTVSIGNTVNVSVANTSFYVTGVGSTVNVNVINSSINVGIGTTGFVSLNQGGSPVSTNNPLPVSIANTAINATINGVSTVAVSQLPDSAVTAFDEPYAISITPVLQYDCVYGLDPNIWRTGTISGAAVTTTSSSTWQITSGLSSTSYGRLTTARHVVYRPGQGSLGRFTAAFTTSDAVGSGITNITQRAGYANREGGYYFGYSGISTQNGFGIVHSYNGSVEIRQLSITTPPSGGNQIATVTLAGIAYTVSVSSGTSTYYTAAQINAGLSTYADFQNGVWETEYCTNYINFTYYKSSPVTGTFSIASTGNLVGTFTTIQSGVTQTEVWTPQTSWNGNPISNFDPSKLNVFQINYRWLGSGVVKFYIENPGTGKMTLVHTQKYGSTSLVPHVIKPSARLVYRVNNTGTVTQTATVTGASVMGAIEGVLNPVGYSHAWYSTSTSGINANTVTHLLTIQNPITRGGKLNLGQLIFQDMSISTQGNDPSIVILIINPKGLSDYLTFQNVPGDFTQYSTTTVTEDLTKDVACLTQTVPINGFAQYTLSPYNLSLAPGDKLSVFVVSTSNLSRTSATLSWRNA